MIVRILLVILIIFFVLIIIKCLDKSYSKEEQIKTLIRQSARWSFAAKQDKNPIISVLHANYGAGYLWALKDIATDTEIESVGNIDILRFRDEIVKVQDEANKKLIRSCPKLVPKDNYLANIAGEG